MTNVMRNRAYIAFVLFLAIIQGANAYSLGAGACEDPGHSGGSEGSGNGGYTLAVTSGALTAGSEVTLTLSGTSNFKGFSVITDQGTFSSFGSGTKSHAVCT